MAVLPVVLTAMRSARDTVVSKGAFLPVGGQNTGGVHGTPTNTMKQEFGSHPGHAEDMANLVINQVTE